MDEKAVNSIFFAKQVIPNSCATHALLSILLNNDKVRHGKTLSKLKEFTKNMNPEDKGHAIGNMPELARAHNSHARPEPRHLPEKQQGISTVRTMEAFHFVSYVPINGHLFELDGLKPYPIDHGPWEETEDWTEKFRRVISKRVGTGTGGEPYHDIWFNLMAVVPDRRQLYENKLNTLKKNRQIILDTLQQMVKVLSPSESSPDKSSHSSDEKPSNKGNIQSHSSEDTVTTEDTQSTSRLPAALDSHNYAKSPIFEGKPMEEKETESNDRKFQSSSDGSHHSSTGREVPRLSAENLQRHQLHTVKESNVKIHIAVSDEREGEIILPKTVSSTDVTKPLKIETRFGGSSGPSSESTDTASESGSGFNSPSNMAVTPTQNSPQERETGAGHQGNKSFESLHEKIISDPSEKMDCDVRPYEGAVRTTPMGSQGHGRSKFSTRQAFTPKDLYDLLKNVEKEITTCENNLKDEVDKRNKYKIDDCRRTHSYDQFICTFLSMLAQEGHLAELVEQHMLTTKRQGVSIGRLNKLPATTQDRRKRARTKRRR